MILGNKYKSFLKDEKRKREREFFLERKIKSSYASNFSTVSCIVSVTQSNRTRQMHNDPSQELKEAIDTNP